MTSENNLIIDEITFAKFGNTHSKQTNRNAKREMKQKLNEMKSTNTPRTDLMHFFMDRFFLSSIDRFTVVLLH